MSDSIVQFHQAQAQQPFISFIDSQHRELKISPLALKHLQKKYTKHAACERLRIFLEKKGCSGYSYELQYTDKIKPEDNCFLTSQTKLAIIVANHDLTRIAGISIDYQVDGINKKLTFTHPLAKGACGCGESVTF